MFYAKILQYEVWGNDADGYEVNNVFDVAKIKLNGSPSELTDKQIIRRLHGKSCYRQWNGVVPRLELDMRRIAIDNSVMDAGMIELTDKQGKPVGRIELRDNKDEMIY